jgi:tetratricopeptide (TPR) repeat protein
MRLVSLMATGPAPKQHRPDRPLKAPPPPPPLRGALVEGCDLPVSDFDIPKEMHTPLGIVLWKSLRDVQVCSEVEPHDRRKLLRPPNEEVRERFAFAREEAPELATALAVFLLLLQTPAVVDARDLALACHQVYEWADQRGMRLIAYHYAEAAAYADPLDPARANFAARMARRALKKDRASLWYLRAHRVAILTKNKRETVYALLGYGTMMKDAGNFKEARRAFDKAATRATGSGRRREAAEAYHDLFAIALELGKLRLAEFHLLTALSFYPARHERIPALAYDIGFLLIRKCHFYGALSVLERTAPLIRRREEQALVWSAVAWAAGGAGLRERFRETERKALELVAVFEDFAPAIFIHLAEGCRALRDWDRAERYAEVAQEYALQREEPPLAQEATELRAAIERRKEAPPAVPETTRAESLVQSALDRLAKWAKAPDRKRPGADPDEPGPPA